MFAVLAVWANRQVLNTDNWTTTSTRLLADPKIQAAVGAVLVNELFKQVDVADELKKVLPSEVSGLAAPAAAGLRALAGQVVPQVLATAPVQEAWRQANKTAQEQLLRILKGGSRPSRPKTARSTLKLHPLLMELAAQVGLQKQLASVQSKLKGSTGETARGAAEEKLGVTLPPPSGNIVILRSSQLKTAQDAVKGLKSLAIVLPVLAIATLHPGCRAREGLAPDRAAHDRMVLRGRGPGRGPQPPRPRERARELGGQEPRQPGSRP